jgi:hypothetical protein
MRGAIGGRREGEADVFPRRLNVASDPPNDGHGRAPRFLHSDSMSECRRERHYRDVVAGPRVKQEAQRAGRADLRTRDGVVRGHFPHTFAVFAS